MGLGKPQLHAKFEVADFIYEGNIRKFVFKNWDKSKWGNLLIFGETDYTIGFADRILPIQCTAAEKWVIFSRKKKQFTMENFKFWEAGMGLKIFGPKYRKAQLYAKTGRINRLAYVAYQ